MQTKYFAHFFPLRNFVGLFFFFFRSKKFWKHFSWSGKKCKKIYFLSLTQLLSGLFSFLAVRHIQSRPLIMMPPTVLYHREKSKINFFLLCWMYSLTSCRLIGEDFRRACHFSSQSDFPREQETDFTVICLVKYRAGQNSCPLRTSVAFGHLDTMVTMVSEKTKKASGQEC